MASTPETPPGSRRHNLAIAVGVVLFVVALWMIKHVLGEYAWDDVTASMEGIAPRAVLAALVFTAGSYLLLIFYDVLALRYVDAKVPWTMTAAASFAANAVGHSVGLTALSGGSIRYRMYASAGVGTRQIAQVIAFCSVTFGLGTALLLGGSLLFEARDAAAVLHAGEPLVIAVGAALTAAVFAYFILNLVRRTPLPILRWQLRLPGAQLAFAQIVVAAVDLAITAAVLYVLLPAGSTAGFGTFLGL